MPRKHADHPLEKVTLLLYAGDMQDMRDLYPRMGVSSVVRSLIRRHLNEQRGREKAPIPVVDVEVKL